MRSYKLSPLAQIDLENIWRYTFETWSSSQADIYLGKIFDALEALAAGTAQGLNVDIRDGYFKYFIGSHICFYKQSDSQIDIIRILHGSVDVQRHL